MYSLWSRYHSTLRSWLNALLYDCQSRTLLLTFDALSQSNSTMFHLCSLLFMFASIATTSSLCIHIDTTGIRLLWSSAPVMQPPTVDPTLQRLLLVLAVVSVTFLVVFRACRLRRLSPLGALDLAVVVTALAASHTALVCAIL
jgi:hypothetical protein